MLACGALMPPPASTVKPMSMFSCVLVSSNFGNSSGGAVAEGSTAGAGSLIAPVGSIRSSSYLAIGGRAKSLGPPDRASMPPKDRFDPQKTSRTSTRCPRDASDGTEPHLSLAAASSRGRPSVGLLTGPLTKTPCVKLQAMTQIAGRVTPGVRAFESLRFRAPRVDAVPNPYLSRECGPTGMAGLPSA